MEYGLRSALRACLFVMVFNSVFCPRNMTAAPAVAYEKAATWIETVNAMRQALSAYKDSFVFSTDHFDSKTKVFPIELDIRDQQYLWLVSSNRDGSVWYSPQLVQDDGTTISLATLEPFAQETDSKETLTSGMAVVAGQNHAQSLMVSGSSKIGYKLDGNYRRFIAKVGLRNATPKGRIDFRICTAPVCVLPEEVASQLFVQIDADFPAHAQDLLVNGVGQRERGELLHDEKPSALLQRATKTALDKLQGYGIPYRDNARQLADQGTTEQRLALLDQVMELQINLYRVRDQIKQRVPVVGRLTYDFSLELTLLREQARYVENQAKPQALGTLEPVAEVGRIESELAAIESGMLSGHPIPKERLQAIGSEAEVLARRFDQLLGWPTVRRDNHRSAITHEHLQFPLQRHWVHTPGLKPQPAWPPPAKINRAVQSPPLDPTLTYDRAFHTVVHDGLVYYGSSADDSVHCLDLDTGKEIWRYTTNGPVRLAPALYGGKCYIGSDDGHLYCLDGKAGTLLWSFRAGPEKPWIPGNGRIISTFPVRCGICVSDNTVYFAAGLFPRQGTFLCALDAQTGAEIFVESLTCSPQGYMLLTPTRILVPTGRTPFVVCDRQSGRQLQQLGRSSSWGQDLKGGSFAVVIEDRIATGPSEDGHIHLFNSQKSEALFRSSGQQILVSGPTAYVLRKDSLLALDRRKYLLEKRESVLWRVHSEQSYCMVMAGSTIFCGTQDGIYAIDAKTGARLWTTAVEGRVEGLVVSLGRLLASTSTGKVYCFSGAASSPRAQDNTLAKSEWSVDPLTTQLADELVALANVDKGYLLLQNWGDAGLAAQLARISDFRIVCAETNRETIDTMRNQLFDANLYGSRVVCHHWPQGVPPYQRYLFNAIATRAESDQALSDTYCQSVQKQLRPHGGLLAVFYQHPSQIRALGSKDEWMPGKFRDTRYVYRYRGALAGEGTWTHPYADPGNSACSNDQFSFADSTIQWFGSPGPRDIVDRHQKSPPPVYAKGRVFVTGSDYIASVDAYNGTVLWENRLAESGRVRTTSNCGNMVAVANRLYVAHSEFCTAFDAQTGQQVFQLSTEQPHTEWGYLAHVNGILLGSSGKSGSIERPLLRLSAVKQQQGGISCSNELFAYDLKTGRRLWSYRSAHGAIINPAIACAGSRICFLESLNPDSRKAEFGRVNLPTLLKQGARLVALDIETGQQIWEAEPDLQNVQFVVYLSATDDRVIITGSCHKKINEAVKNRYAMIAYDAVTGQLQWTSLENPGYEDAIDGNHGAWNQHPAIVGDIIYGNGYARHILSGQESAGWKWTKSHKCATLSASGRCAFSRYENAKLPFMFDLKSGKRQALTTVSRPGCWINTLPVGGLVLIPEASAGCTCGYSIQTSLALSLDPQVTRRLP